MASVRDSKEMAVSTSTPSFSLFRVSRPPRAPLSIGEQILEKQTKLEKSLDQLQKYYIELKSSVSDEKIQAEHERIGRDFSVMGEEIFNIGVANGTLPPSVKQIGSGLMQIGISLITSNIAGIYLGIFQLGMGAFSLFDSGDEAVTANQLILDALYSIAQMIQKGFNLVLEKQAFMSWQMNQLSIQVTRIENLLRITSRESYLQNYLTLTNKLNNYLYNKGVLAQRSDILKDLRDLESWVSIEGQTYKSTVTGAMLLNDDFDAGNQVSILSHRDFDSLSMLGYLSALLQRFSSSRFTPEMKLNLPNVRILLEASMLYKNVIEKFRPEGNVVALFESIAKQWQNITDYLNALRTNSALWDSLITQIHSYFREVNQRLAFLEKTNKFSKPEGTISDILPEGSERVQLTKSLDALEVRRLLIIRFYELLGHSPILSDKIKELPSKASLLARTRDSLKEANKQIMIAGQKGDVSQVKSALEAGANPCSILIYPTVLRGEAKQSEFILKKNSLEILNLLIQYSTSYNPLPLTTFVSNWPTAYYHTSPIVTLIWKGCFEQIILLCANGFETTTSTSRKGPFLGGMQRDFYL